MSQIKVYSVYHENRINDLSANVDAGFASVQAQASADKSALEARILADEQALTAYKSSNDVRVATLESTVATNKSTYDAYVLANDARVASAEALIASNKSALDSDIADLDAKVDSNKIAIDASLSAVRTELKEDISGVLDELITDTGLSTRIDTLFDEKLNSSYFETVKTALETADSSLNSELTSKFTEAVSKHDEQAVVLNELVRLVGAIYAGMVVQDASGNAITPDSTKLQDTTSA